jgi:drug/metabolite transporter (DMT)-like permease
VHLVIMLATFAPRMGRHLIVTESAVADGPARRHPGRRHAARPMALTTMPLAETTALVFVAPLLVALLAGPLLGETVGLRTWLATVAGFAGVLLIARPGGSLLAAVGVACALAAALSYAAYQILTRKLVASEPPLRLLFHTALFGTLVMSPAVPIFWDGRLPTVGQGLLVVSLGIYGGLGHFLLIRAFAETPASLLSPLLYVQLVWAALLGWLIFDQLPDLPAIFGMLIIGASGLSLALRRQR